MSEADELFNKAYEIEVVEEKHREAIDLCRAALEVDRDHYKARVFLGIILGDYGNDEEKDESRRQFSEAIERAKNVSALCKTGFEESAIHHLGIWEWSREHYYNACLYFLANSLICNRVESGEHLIKLLNELDPVVAEDMRRLLEGKKTLR